MRVLILCCLLISSLPLQSASEEELGGIIEDIILAAIDAIKGSIPDPLTIPLLEVDLTNSTSDLLRGYGNVSDFKLSGIKGLNVTEIVVTDFTTLNMTIALDLITLDTLYYLDFTLIKLLPIYGSGIASVHLNQLQLTIGGTVQLEGLTHLSITNLTVLINLGGAVFDLHGILDNESFSLVVNEILDFEVPRIINSKAELISSIISPIIEQLVNQILNPNSTVIAQDYSPPQRGIRLPVGNKLA